MAAGGLVIKTQDGTTYFIRDEILDACKVADDELEVTEAMVEESGDVEGFALSLVQPVQIGTSVAALPAITPNLKGTGIPWYANTTSMCCW